MSWAALANEQWVSCNDLQDAVTTGVFTLKAGQTIPTSDQWITRAQAETWINCTVSNGTSAQWPQKSWITPLGVPHRVYNTYLEPYRIQGVCDCQDFPHTLYTPDVDPPYTTMYTDIGLTNIYVGNAYVSIPSITDYQPLHSRQTSGGSGSWGTFYKKQSQTFGATTCTANVGTNTYSKKIGDSIWRRQGSVISNISVTISAVVNAPVGSRWRVSWNTGGPDIGTSVIWTSAWTTIAVSSNISNNNVVSTCDTGYMEVELESATVADGTQITVSGSWTI